jgi:hypothetical protein
MDLVADMLLEHLPLVAGDEIQATRLRPPMTRRWSRLPMLGSSTRAWLADRLTSRVWDYPRWLRTRAAQFDLFHIIDHSYAHLAQSLPRDRTIVSCYDLDAIYAALPGRAGHLGPRRLLASGVVRGLARARHVACVTDATRNELTATGRVDRSRTSVVHVGVHPSCTPSGMGKTPDGAIELLHVGSTIPRKRIDVLLHVFSRLRRTFPMLMLRRVGGSLTAEQRTLAQELGVSDAITEMN